jgi:uncharacterized membrane protein
VMNGSLFVLAIALFGVAAGACAHEPTSPPVPAHARPTATGSTCRHAMPSCVGTAPTYAEDVRPVLEQRCFKCHAGDGVAAEEHDFSRLETLRAQKMALANEVGACAMPPSSEPALSDEEAERLLLWVACGRE